MFCPKCEKAHDADLFSRDRVVLCGCGAWVRAPERVRSVKKERAASGVFPRHRARARAEVEELARRADRISALILYSDMPMIDVEIEIERLRGHCRERFPESLDLFGMVYESRWRRFREQGWARRRKAFD